MQNANDEQINDNKKGQRENTPAIRNRDGQCKGREVICMGGGSGKSASDSKSGRKPTT